MSRFMVSITIAVLFCSYFAHGDHIKNSSNTPVRKIHLIDEEKYKNPSEDSDEDFYNNSNITNQEPESDIANDIEDTEEENDTIDSVAEAIVLDHIEFVLLRLKHIASKISSNITEILTVQKEEFQQNELYENGWKVAVEKFYVEGIKERVFNNTSPDSIVHKVPVEYHIALVAFTLSSPPLHVGFNKDTRDICSGTDIGNYQWKSYFKLLHLAIETLGTQVDKWVDRNRFLYRGSNLAFHLEEGQILAFQQFSSSSVSLGVAEIFAENGNATNFRTIFEYQGFYNGTAVALWDHSDYPWEMEVLFTPIQAFQVDSVHVGIHYTRYVLIKHEEPSRPDYNDVYAHPGIKNEADRLTISGKSDFFNGDDDEGDDASAGDNIHVRFKSVLSLFFLSYLCQRVMF
ncbi:unnamed protein product [Orchesella dallaii]|uniref:NAD(P)(+)--arginine ADP-ribosyltransferase n=1 Tax=Orchesella dallaii TaxID=48710 RepID=A0ABP1PQS6_9HEXA